jgi:hypothetical protein
MSELIQYMTGDDYWKDSDVKISVKDNKQMDGKMTFTLDYNGVVILLQMLINKHRNWSKSKIQSLPNNYWISRDKKCGRKKYVMIKIKSQEKF